MHNAEDICLCPLTEVADLIRKRVISPVDVTNAVLARIEEWNPAVNCYITVLSDRARHRARALEDELMAGRYYGPLHGIPISLKDNIATARVRTTAGSPILADWIPAANAAVVDRLERAGAIVVGKTNLYEFAYGAPHPQFGPTRNPWCLQLSCSGSSSGSVAAVSAGLCYGSLGTDTGGSIRNPAALCGVVGFKPTCGLVSRAGVVPVSYSLDHVGPIARTVPDVAAILQTVAGHDAADPASASSPIPDYSVMLDEGVAGLRVGVAHSRDVDVLAPEVRSGVLEAYELLESEGAILRDVEIPDHGLARTVMSVIAGAEAAEYHRPNLRTRADAYHPEVRSLLERGEFIPATDYVHAHRVRQRISNDLRLALADVDVLVLPGFPVPAYPVGQRSVVLDGREIDVAQVTRYTTLFNLTGHPAIVLPCGFTSAGLPIGFQIVGHRFADSMVLRAARAYERATTWHLAHPQLAAQAARQENSRVPVQMWREGGQQ